MEVKQIAVKGKDGEVRTMALPGAENGAGLETVRRIAVRSRTGEIHTLEFPREDPVPYLNGAHILFRAAVGENTLHLLQSQTDKFDCTVHWGDGTSTKAPPRGGNLVHNYGRAGDYHIFVTGKSFAGFCVNNQEGKEKYIAAYSMGRWEQDTMTKASYMFYGCVNLSELGGDLFRYTTSLTNFFSCFEGCTSLTELPDDLFRYNTAAEDFCRCFYGCTGLTVLPADLFRYNTAAHLFNLCFSECSSLVLREDIFGTGNEETRFTQVYAVGFYECFYRTAAEANQGTAPALWNYTLPENSSKAECFGGAGNNAETLSNYADIPAEWKEGTT